MNLKMALFFLLISFSDLSHALYGSRPLTASSNLSSIVTLHLNDSDKPEYDSFCSGVLVAPNKILTTGHCIEVIGTELYEQWNRLVYEPSLMKVKVAGVKYDVADVMIADTYTEAVGFEGEDLALITLKRSVTSVKPLRLIAKSALKAGLPVSLVARGKIADTKITSVKTFSGNTVIFTDGSKSGVCEGDSGGALLVKSADGYSLAGILSAQSEGCYKQTGVSLFAHILK
jgi:secreted trypsin-like serine protease